jgi:anti-sigma factor RsiW
MRRAYATEALPARLWDHIAQRLDAEDGRVGATKATLLELRARITKNLEQVRHRLVPLWRRPAAVLAAIALIAVVTIAADPLALRKEHRVNALIREPVNDLITYRMSRRSPDFETADPRTISEWWADKLDFRVPTPVAELGGYRLIGGRLCYFLNRRLTALMYRKDDHVVSLYVM